MATDINHTTSTLPSRAYWTDSLEYTLSKASINTDDGWRTPLEFMSTNVNWYVNNLEVKLLALVNKLRKRDKDFILYPLKHAFSETGTPTTINKIAIAYPSDPFPVCEVEYLSSEFIIQAPSLKYTGRNSYGMDRTTTRLDYAAKIIRNDCPRYDVHTNVLCWSSRDQFELNSAIRQVKSPILDRPRREESDVLNMIKLIATGQPDAETVRLCKELHTYYAEQDRVDELSKRATLVVGYTTPQGVEHVYLAEYDTTNGTRDYVFAKPPLFAKRVTPEVVPEELSGKLAVLSQMDYGNVVPDMGAHISHNMFLVAGKFDWREQDTTTI